MEEQSVLLPPYPADIWAARDLADVEAHLSRSRPSVEHLHKLAKSYGLTEADVEQWLPDKEQVKTYIREKLLSHVPAHDLELASVAREYQSAAHQGGLEEFRPKVDTWKLESVFKLPLTNQPDQLKYNYTNSNRVREHIIRTGTPEEVEQVINDPSLSQADLAELVEYASARGEIPVAATLVAQVPDFKERAALIQRMASGMAHSGNARSLEKLVKPSDPLDLKLAVLKKAAKAGKLGLIKSHLSEGASEALLRSLARAALQGGKLHICHHLGYPLGRDTLAAACRSDSHSLYKQQMAKHPRLSQAELAELFLEVAQAAIDGHTHHQNSCSGPHPLIVEDLCGRIRGTTARSAPVERGLEILREHSPYNFQLAARTL